MVGGHLFQGFIFPQHEGRLHTSAGAVILCLQGRANRSEPLQFFGLGLVGDGKTGFSFSNDGLLDVSKEGPQAVEILRGERIILVVVALAATDRRPQPDRADGADPVGDVAGLIVLGLGPAFFGGEEEPVECRTDLRLDGGIFHQITRQLFNGETVVGLVGVERPDHIIPVRPDVAGIVAVVADGVGEAHHVEPADGHALPIML